MRSFYKLAACSALLISGVAVVSTPSPSSAAIQCPDTWGGTIKCDYYKDGYKAGKQDRKAGLSMYYGRHDGAYDSRNESYYQAGYEDGWQGK